MAAVIGREFRLDVLQLVADLSEEELYAALEEAQGTVVIEERSSVGGVVSFWFSHAFFKQTHYEEVFTPRRIRLHQEVAQALEEVYMARLEEHATELAEHFSHSSDPADLAKAIGYGEMASQRAKAVYTYVEGVALLRKGLELARRLDDHETFWLAACAWLLLVTAPQHGEEGLKLAEEVTARSRASVGTIAVANGLHASASSFIVWGQRRLAEEVWREANELAQRTGQATVLSHSMVATAILATLEGRLEDAVATCQSISTRGDELGISGYARLQSSQASVGTLLILGKGDDALQTAIYPQQKALCLAHLGRNEEVAALLEEQVLARPGIGSEEDEARTDLDIMLLEAAVLVGHGEAADLLLRRFAGTEMRTTGVYRTTCIARHLGSAAALLGWPDEARAYFNTGLDVCREMPFRPEEALTHLHLAELLLEYYPNERAEALDHLDTALAEFRDMKMQPSLERVLALKLDIQGVASVDFRTSIDAVVSAVSLEQPDPRPYTAPDGTVIILFSDIEGSTQMTERLGDQRMQQILRGHNDIVRHQVAAYGGFEVKSLGDGFMLAFSSARRALQRAISIQQAFTAYNREHAEEPVRVRIGLHTGEFVQEMEDFFGKNVILASRIADQAKGGQILVSALLKELTKSAGDIRFGQVREVELKGLAGVNRVYAVEWE